MKRIFPKIVVILSAVVLWFLIVSGQTYIGVVDIPLSVYEPREDMTMGGVLPKTVKVRVEGTGRGLYFKQWTSKSSLILDVGAINNDQRISLKNYFRERPNQVRLQSDMTFLEVVYPDSIDILIDKKVDKVIPVNIRTDIKVRSGFIQVNEPDVQEVVLSGPEKLLAQIDQCETEMLEGDNVDMSFTKEVHVINPNSELIKIEPEKLDVNILVEMIGERSILSIPVSVKNKPADLDIQFIPNNVSLRITGGNDQIQSLKAEDFSVYFDYLSQWFPNKNYYPVKVTLPREVLDVIRVIPEQIEVVVIKKNEVNG